MVKLIVIDKNKYVYNGEAYEFKEDTVLIKKTGVNRKIVIMDEPLLIKIYKIEVEKIFIEEYVDEIISRDFSLDDDLLFHYEYSKPDKCIFIYSIKKHNLIEPISKGAKKLEVIPIQFYIKDEIFKKLPKYRRYISVIKIRDRYYFNNVVNGYILNAYVTNFKDELNCYLKRHKNDVNEFILDYSCDFNNEFQKLNLKSIKYLKIGESINEKLFKKQRFYSRKLS